MLANWVSKAANLLQDDAAAEPGTTVGIDLPAHWRSVYWALATWSVGATVVLGDSVTGADVLVTDSPERAAAHGGDTVLVTLAALARAHPRAGEVPGAVDEARELSTHGDLFSPMADPERGRRRAGDGGRRHGIRRSRRGGARLGRLAARRAAGHDGAGAPAVPVGVVGRRLRRDRTGRQPA